MREEISAPPHPGCDLHDHDTIRRVPRRPAARSLTDEFYVADAERALAQLVTQNPGEAGRLVVETMIKLIGDTPGRSGIEDTPARVVKSWKELFGGYALDPAAILGTTFEKNGFDQIILCKDIEFYSTCEHHMLPIIGTAHVAYVPGERVVGLSKLARLVDLYARRLQIQERFTVEIADALEANLKTQGVGVVVEAKHFCMCARGVGKQGSAMTTSAMRGVFREDATARAELLRLIGG